MDDRQPRTERPSASAATGAVIMSVDAHRSTSSTASALSAVSVALSGEVTNRLSNPLGPVHHGKMARLTAGNGKNRRAGMASDAGLRGEMRTPGQITAVGAGLAFPHAAQAIQIVRRRRPLTGKNSTKWCTETVYAITSLTVIQARPAELARFIRGPWGIRPASLGPRRHLRRGPIPGPHRPRTPRHGQPAQPGHRHLAAGRPYQHRRRPALSRPPARPAATTDHAMLTTTSPSPGGAGNVVRVTRVAVTNAS